MNNKIMKKTHSFIKLNASEEAKVKKNASAWNKILKKHDQHDVLKIKHIPSKTRGFFIIEKKVK